MEKTSFVDDVDCQVWLWTDLVKLWFRFVEPSAEHRNENKKNNNSNQHQSLCLLRSQANAPR